MTRWRAPGVKSSAYITPSGFKILQAELQALWARRAGVVQALSEAAAEGDRSENAEYIYRKKELREIDRRLRYLQNRLPDLTVVGACANQSQVFFGAWVKLEDDDGQEVNYRIVGPDEFDSSKGWISMDSPLARALLKKSVDDEVVVMTPKGEAHYYISDIRYEPEL